VDNESFSTTFILKHHTCNEKNQAKAYSPTQRKLRKAKLREQEVNKQTIASQQRKKVELIHEMHRTIRLHFPQLLEWMREVDDCRTKNSDYELAAHLTACLAMFLFKSGSRNQYNQLREEPQFRENYERLFGFSMPHGDSVQNVMALLDQSQIEHLKHTMILKLMERKVFHSRRYRGKWFLIAVDASGVGSYDHQRDEQCLHRTSKAGKTTYFHSVLEARLVTATGFCISIVSEWIENPEGGEYDKQDCERKGYTRIAARLKALFPRLPILILADGLYPYEGFFNICRANRWSYCVTLKDGNLPSVWEEARALQALQRQNNHREVRHRPNGTTVKQAFEWVINIDYKGHTLNWLECVETINRQAISEEEPTPTRFVHITDLVIDVSNRHQPNGTFEMEN